jgi:hypothetical protein
MSSNNKRVTHYKLSIFWADDNKAFENDKRTTVNSAD